MNEWGKTREERTKNLDTHVRAGLAKQPHYVYRCYDVADTLLYIGCARDVIARLDVHRSSWNNPASAALNLRMVRHTSVEYPSKAAARQAERDAIYNEAPLFNLHHQKVKQTPAARRVAIEEYVQATRQPFDWEGFDAAIAAFSKPQQPLADTG